MADPKVIITIQAQDKASGEIQAIASGVVSNLTKMEQAGSSMSGSFSRLQGVIAAFGASLSVAGVSQFAKSIWDAGAKIQSVELALKSVTGSSSAAAAEFRYVKDTAVKLGLDLETAAQGYKTIAAAAMGTTLKSKDVRDIFTGVSEASAALGLSSQQTEKALLALGQMLSKNKVQAEELRGQLGDAIPIAMSSAAQATGVTTAQFQKLMEEGKVISDDFVPKLTKLWHEMFSVEALNAANTFQGATNRMATAWLDMRGALADTRVFENARSFVLRLADAVTILSDKVRAIDLSNLSGTKTSFYKKVSGGAEFTFPDFKNLTSAAAQDLTEFEKTRKEIEKEVTKGLPVSEQKAKEIADFKKNYSIALTESEMATALKGIEDKWGKKGKGGAAVSYEDINQKIDQFTSKVTASFADLETANYDLWISMAQNSGDFYTAASLEVDKWVAQQKEAIDKDLLAAQTAYRELEESITGKRGATGEASAAAQAARVALNEAEAVSIERRNTLTAQEIEKRKALTTVTYQQQEKTAALKLEYAELTGNSNAIYAATIELIEAERKLNIEQDKGNESLHTANALEKTRQAELKKTGTILDGFTDSFSKWVQEQDNGYKAGTELFDKFQSSIDDLAESLAEFTVTGKLSWSDMLTDMAEEAAKFLYKSAFTDLVNAFKGTSTGGSVVSWISSLFGGGSSAAASSAGSFGSAFFNVWHAGGMVGSGGGASRAVSTGLLAGAPRLHSGLNPDEFPAILQRGETVIPAGQSAASQTIATNINVSVNQQGKYDQAESQRLGSEVSRMIEQSFNANLQKQLRPGGILNRGING